MLNQTLRRSFRRISKGIIGGGFHLPFAFNPAVVSDGSMPYPWVGPTFSIVSGKITNTPTTTPVTVTDFSLEAAYTAGLCGTLTKVGSPTLADVVANLHAGSHAQEFTGAAVNNALHQNVGAAVALAWYRYHRWAKRTVGSTKTAAIRITQTAGTRYPASGVDDAIQSASYVEKKVAVIVTTTDAILLYSAQENGSSSFPTVVADDGYLYRLTVADCFALLPAGDRLATVKCQPDTLVDACFNGLIAWYDSTGYLMANWRLRNDGTFIAIGLMKNVGGTWTQLITEQAITVVPDAYLEIRMVDNDTVAVYYNNVQVSVNKDVADVLGAQAGLVHTGGGNNIKNFSWG